MKKVPFKSEVLAVVASVPEGRVTTYGTIAQHLDITPRQVAFVLSRLTAEESKSLPWFRVVASKGVVSTVKLGAVGRRQIENCGRGGCNQQAKSSPGLRANCLGARMTDGSPVHVGRSRSCL